MNLSSLLPKQSLPEFSAFKAAKPEILWSNPRTGDRLDIDDYAYFMPISEDDKSACTSSQKTFLAERYGGHGIAANGGGVRCGLLNNLHVKGIGQNLLVGEGTDYFHTYGGASANEGIVEALWGEIFHKVLPYGSARVHALIGTNTEVPLVLPIPGESPMTARALIVRDAVLRPAHYIRAPYFNPIKETDSLCHDTLRTQYAVNHLLKAVREIFDDDEYESNRDGYLNDRLIKIFYRYGHQVAAARSKRLMHGSLLSSNISLDARWIDFGTASSMSTWGHIISPKGPDFLCEELMMHPMIVEFIFSLRKYLPAKLRKELGQTSEYWKHLNTGLEEQSPLLFSKLSGVPTICLSLISQDIIMSFWRSFKSAIEWRNNKRYVIMSDNSPQSMKPLKKTGELDLLAILRNLAVCRDPAGAESMLENEVQDANIRSNLVKSYYSLRNAAAMTYPVANRAKFFQFCQLNAMRYTTSLKMFYRPRLYKTVGDVVRRAAPLQPFLNKYMALSDLLICDDVDGRIDLDIVFGAKSHASHEDGIVIRGDSVEFTDVVTMFENFIDVDTVL